MATSVVGVLRELLLSDERDRLKQLLHDKALDDVARKRLLADVQGKLSASITRDGFYVVQTGIGDRDLIAAGDPRLHDLDRGQRGGAAGSGVGPSDDGAALQGLL